MSAVCPLGTRVWGFRHFSPERTGQLALLPSFLPASLPSLLLCCACPSTILAIPNGLIISFFQHAVACAEGYHYFERKAPFSFSKAFCGAGGGGGLIKETPNGAFSAETPWILPLNLLYPLMLWKVSFIMYCLSHHLLIFFFSNQSKNCYSEFQIISIIVWWVDLIPVKSKDKRPLNWPVQPCLRCMIFIQFLKYWSLSGIPSLRGAPEGTTRSPLGPGRQQGGPRAREECGPAAAGSETKPRLPYGTCNVTTWCPNSASCITDDSHWLCKRATPFSLLWVHTVPHQEFFLLQEENRPVGGFSLRGSLVSALEDNGVPTGKVQLRASLQASGCSRLHSQWCSADGLNNGGLSRSQWDDEYILEPISEWGKGACGVFLVFSQHN